MNTMESQRETAGRAFYAVIGAPVVTGRKLRDFGMRVAVDLAGEAGVWEEEGRKLTGQIQDSKVVEQAIDRVEQVQERVDVEQIQEQVEKLRDQLEHVLVTWRIGFNPTNTKVEEKPAPRKATAAKKTATKATAVKKPAAKKPAAKKPTTSKASDNGDK